MHVKYCHGLGEIVGMHGLEIDLGSEPLDTAAQDREKVFKSRKRELFPSHYCSKQRV